MINTVDKSVTVVKKAHNGDIICAGIDGLFVTDKQFTKWTVLSGGAFSDVVVDKDQLIALQYNNPIVHTYRLSQQVGSNGQESSWHKCHSFMLTVTVNCNSSICIVGEQYLLIATKTKGIPVCKLTRGGEYLDSCTELPPRAKICGTDKKGHVLVADFRKGTMYVFKLSQNEMQKTALLSDFETPDTRSAIIDQNNNVWVLAGNDGIYKLIKFVSEP